MAKNRLRPPLLLWRKGLYPGYKGFFSQCLHLPLQNWTTEAFIGILPEIWRTKDCVNLNASHGKLSSGGTSVYIMWEDQVLLRKKKTQYIPGPVKEVDYEARRGMYSKLMRASFVLKIEMPIAYWEKHNNFLYKICLIYKDISTTWIIHHKSSTEITAQSHSMQITLGL